jgi:hypothetical protein
MSTTPPTPEETLNRISPKPPTPLYPDVPWWAVLIAAFVFSFLGIVIGVYALKDGFGSGAAGKITGSSFAVDTISYLPHILLLFGVLADMFTLQGVYSIPSLVGVLSIFGNYVFQYFWKGIDELVTTGKNAINKGTGTTPGVEPAPGQTGKGKRGGGDLFEGYKGCSVQGFESFNSTPLYAPQTLVITATVFSYYCYDLVRNRGWINSIGAILAFVSTYIGEVVVIDFQNPGGCGESGSVVSQGVRALFEGLMFGGVSYGIVQTYAPTRLPSSVISPFPRKSAGDLTPGPDGKMYDSDGYPYIILPNGQAVPDISDAASRAAFGQLAGGATGQPASVGSNCPGQKAGCPPA